MQRCAVLLFQNPRFSVLNFVSFAVSSLASVQRVGEQQLFALTCSCIVQGDIFSLGVMMYELFTMCPLATKVCMGSTHGDHAAYAAKVRGGHREPLDKSWPQELRETIGLCWHDCPDIRPTAEDLLSMLSSLEGKVLYMDAYCPRKVVKASARSAQHAHQPHTADVATTGGAALPKCFVM